MEEYIAGMIKVLELVLLKTPSLFLDWRGGLAACSHRTWQATRNGIWDNTILTPPIVLPPSEVSLAHMSSTLFDHSSSFEAYSGDY